jgi:transposase
MHPGSRIGTVYLYRTAIDFRKSIGGLSALVERELGLNPFGDGLYVFINRRRDKLKALYWHRNGFCLWYKRLEAERFAWPSVASSAVTQELTLQELEWLLEGFDLWAHRPHKTLKYQSVT